MGVMVLGVGRSGTSLATAVIAAMARGSELPSDDFPVTEENPRGYNESATLTGMNQQLLEALGGSWNVPPDLSPGWEAQLKARPEFGPGTSRSVFRAVLKSGAWVWKDPRNTMLAPYWFGVLPDVEGLVLVYRDPVEVAASTSRQFPDMTVEHGLALWERCCRLAITAAHGFPTVVICHGDLIYDPDLWRPAARAFVSHVGFAPAEVSPVDRLIDQSLHRQRNEGLARAAMSERLTRLAGVLDGLRGFHDHFPKVDLGAESPEVEPFFASLRGVSADRP